MPVSHEKSPIEQALDLAVFGPLGLVLTAKESFPAWVDAGRDRLVHQVGIARLVGEQAARYGQKMATDTLVGFGILPGPPPPAPRGPAPGADGGGAAPGADRGGAAPDPDGGGAAPGGGGGDGAARGGSGDAAARGDGAGAPARGTGARSGSTAGRGGDIQGSSVDGAASLLADSEAPSPNGRPAARATVAPVEVAPAPGSAELAIPGYDSLSASQVVQRLAGLAVGELEAVRTYETAGRGRRTILTKISQLQTGRS